MDFPKIVDHHPVVTGAAVEARACCRQTDRDLAWVSVGFWAAGFAGQQSKDAALLAAEIQCPTTLDATVLVLAARRLVSLIPSISAAQRLSVTRQLEDIAIELHNMGEVAR